MREIVAIDGPRGAGKTVVATAVAAGLGWPLVSLPGEGSPPPGARPDAASALAVWPEPAVLEGLAVLQSAGADARWKFHLEADPRERARRLAEAADGEDADLQAVLARLLEAERTEVDGAIRRLVPAAILIDTTDLPAAAVAAMIVAIVRSERE